MAAKVSICVVQSYSECFIAILFQPHFRICKNPKTSGRTELNAYILALHCEYSFPGRKYKYQNGKHRNSWQC